MLAGWLRMPVVVLSAAVLGAPAMAQQKRPQASASSVTVSSLTAQGFEVKAVGMGQALIVQKGKEVYWCVLHVSGSRPLSYQSECFSIQ